MATDYRATNILIEDKASGTQLIQDLIREGAYGLTRFEPKMEKIMRLHSVTSTIENGFVYLPEQAEWLNEYLRELTTFPNGKHDDQTDSTSQALDWIKGRFYAFPLFEYYRREAEKLGLSIDSYGNPLPKEDARGCIAVHKTTGRKIRWNGQCWLDYNTGEPYVE